ncbi:very long chain fatty acid elongase AAEL008004-like isoform X2 [Bacillus rossius redtenbacheri]|uniref:very long chain fatty acid elongase AAEL008004-like isoform X2 n=1 Tax=Bacillus rossius redtenbacheri TaxID=93214 RepID=UPI002FDCF2A6
MSRISTFVTDYYDYVTYKLADQRVKDWPLLGSPVPLLLIVGTYLYVIRVAGPWFMRNRKPYALKNVIVAYNVFQVLANAYIAFGMLTSGWIGNPNVTCFPPDYSHNPTAMRMAKMVWYMMVLKVLDFLETGFFILRKKENQASFLHVYHHVSTVMLAYLTAKYIPGGGVTFQLILNCSVHVVMYSYYLLSLVGPDVPLLRSFVRSGYMTTFKKSLTTIQMVQFVIMILYCLYLIFNFSCPTPTIIHHLLLLDVIYIFYLFYDFYKATYLSKKAS